MPPTKTRVKLPSVGDHFPAIDEPVAVAEPPRISEKHLVSIDVPLAEFPPHGYATRHIEVRLTENQAHTLKRIFTALERDGAKLASGQPIRKAPDVVRYLLDEIADRAV